MSLSLFPSGQEISEGRLCPDCSQATSECIGSPQLAELMREKLVLAKSPEWESTILLVSEQA
jgi:hypothetical protein